MATNFRITIANVSGGNYVPVTTGSYSLRVTPFSVSTYAGSHVANGSWNFGTVADGEYQLWDESGTPAQVASWGTQQLVDSAISSIGITLPSNMAAGGYKITGLGAGSGAGDSVRYEQVALLAGATFTGQVIFTTTGGIVPTVSNASSTGLPTASGHLCNKYYVDQLYGSVVTPPFAPYSIQLISSRTEDSYSKQDIESCYTYLAGLANIQTYRGVIIIPPVGASLNNVSVDNGTDQWCGNGIDIFSYNKTKLTRQAANSSLTSTTKITNCYISDSIAAGRAYVNFTFQDCDLYFNTGGNSPTFTSCKFLGSNRMYVQGGTYNLVNCTGDTLLIADSGGGTISGTRPVNLVDGLDNNNLGV